MADGIERIEIERIGYRDDEETMPLGDRNDAKAHRDIGGNTQGDGRIQVETLQIDVVHPRIFRESFRDHLVGEKVQREERLDRRLLLLFLVFCIFERRWGYPLGFLQEFQKVRFVRVQDWEGSLQVNDRRKFASRGDRYEAISRRSGR